MMQSFDLEMLFYAFLIPQIFLNEIQMFRIIFFFRSHSCKHIKNVIEMRMQRTSEDSKRKVGLSSSHLAKKRRIISSDNKTST